jgi:hypothetical protein
VVKEIEFEEVEGMWQNLRSSFSFSLLGESVWTENYQLLLHPTLCYFCGA